MSLQDKVKQIFIDQVLRANHEENHELKILVLDDYTLNLVNKCCTPSEILDLDNGIKAIHHIKLSRNEPRSEALYRRDNGFSSC